MKKYKILGVIIILAAVVLIAAGCAKKTINNTSTETTAKTDDATSTFTTLPADDNGTVASATTDSKLVSYKGEDGKNALELLKKAAKVEYEDSANGAFVSSINGIKNSDKEYWIFYLDGKMAEVASDKYTTKSTDTIEWKYQGF